MFQVLEDPLFKMSSIITSRGLDYADLDIDELVDKLTPGEIQKLLEDCDPDDSQIPPGLRYSTILIDGRRDS